MSMVGNRVSRFQGPPRRVYQRATGVLPVPSAFHDRFTWERVRLPRRVVAELSGWMAGREPAWSKRETACCAQRGEKAPSDPRVPPHPWRGAV